jgi:hypothetical protein
MQSNHGRRQSFSSQMGATTVPPPANGRPSMQSQRTHSGNPGLNLNGLQHQSTNPHDGPPRLGPSPHLRSLKSRTMDLVSTAILTRRPVTPTSHPENPVLPPSWPPKHTQRNRGWPPLKPDPHRLNSSPFVDLAPSTLLSNASSPRSWSSSNYTARRCTEPPRPRWR